MEGNMKCAPVRWSGCPVRWDWERLGRHLRSLGARAPPPRCRLSPLRPPFSAPPQRVLPWHGPEPSSVGTNWFRIFQVIK